MTWNQSLFHRLVQVSTDKAAFVALKTIHDLAESGVDVPRLIQFVLFDDATYNCYTDALSDL